MVLAATPEGAVASLQGGICPSCCFGKVGGGSFGVTHLARKARPYLRQQMPQIFGQMLKRLLPPKGKGVIRKRGETLVSPLLCACRAQRPASRRLQAAKSPARDARAPSLPYLANIFTAQGHYLRSIFTPFCAAAMNASTSSFVLNGANDTRMALSVRALGRPSARSTPLCLPLEHAEPLDT